MGAKRFVAYLIAANIFTAAGCSLGLNKNPDKEYLQAKDAQVLEVPPDLAGPDRTQQLVIPGLLGQQLTAHTLLPVFESIRFVRDGSLQWLEIDAVPEKIWEDILSFWAAESFELETKNPLTGIIRTEWVRDGKPIPKTGFQAYLKKLLGTFLDSDNLDRYTMRVERKGDKKSLIFLTHERAVDLGEVDDITLEVTKEGYERERDPQAEIEMLREFLLFLGVKEQVASGLLDGKIGEQIIKGHALERSDDGHVSLFVARPFFALWDNIENVLDQLDLSVEKADFKRRKMELMLDKTPASADQFDQAEADAMKQLFDGEEQEKELLISFEEVAGGTYLRLTDINGTLVSPVVEEWLLNKIKSKLKK